MIATPAVGFVSVRAGAVAISHRPKIKLLPVLRSEGATHLVTLLSRREGAPALGTAANAAGLEWIWVDLPNGRLPPPERHDQILTALTTLTGLLDEGAAVVVHCSAGLHRTGMFTYALLRTCDFDPDDALRMLTRMRAATAEEVGAHRLAWGEDLSALARRRLAGESPVQEG